MIVLEGRHNAFALLKLSSNKNNFLGIANLHRISMKSLLDAVKGKPVAENAVILA